MEVMMMHTRTYVVRPRRANYDTTTQKNQRDGETTHPRALHLVEHPLPGLEARRLLRLQPRRQPPLVLQRLRMDPKSIVSIGGQFSSVHVCTET